MTVFQICHHQFYCVNVYESVLVSLQACGKHFCECIISLRVEACAYKLVLPRYFYWNACSNTGMWAVMYMCVSAIDCVSPIQECERSCICVLALSIVPLSTILIFDFWQRCIFSFSFYFNVLFDWIIFSVPMIQINLNVFYYVILTNHSEELLLYYPKKSVWI